MTDNTQPSTASSLQAKRKRWLAIAIGSFAMIGIAYGAYWAFDLRYVQSTDDAL